MTVTVAALQLASRLGDVDGNLRHLEEVLAELPPDCHLAVAPELYTTGYDLDMIGTGPLSSLAEPVDGPSVTRLRKLAEATDMTLVVGFLEGDGQQVFDSVVVTSPGAPPAVYRKTHLYPPELSVFGEGDELVVAPSPAGRLGLMICFEHAFPEVASTLALAGTDILVIPSAVPVGYEHVLSLRTRARAQDNQIFAIGSNMASPFCGRSLIVDPRGQVLAEAGTGEEVITAAIDLDQVTAERRREPSLRLRRPELYE